MKESTYKIRSIATHLFVNFTAQMSYIAEC